MRERTTACAAWKYLKELGANTTSYSLLKAFPTPTLHDCDDATAYLQNHRVQRNALLSANPTDHLASIQHSMHLILEGLPSDEPAVYTLQCAFDVKSVFTIEDLEVLHKAVLRLPTSTPYAASASRGRTSRTPGVPSQRKRQPAGRPELTYNCQYCLADNHKEAFCVRKKRGDPGLFAGRAPRMQPRVQSTAPQANNVTAGPDPGLAAAISALQSVVERMEQLFTPVVNESSNYTASHANRERFQSMLQAMHTHAQSPVTQTHLPPALDTAASHTMVRSHDELECAKPTTVPVRMADRSTTPATASGTALLRTDSSTVRIPNALHVPTLARTLIAVSQLAARGSVLITGNKFWYTRKQDQPHPSLVIAQGVARNGVYEFTDQARQQRRYQPQD